MCDGSRLDIMGKISKTEGIAIVIIQNQNVRMKNKKASGG
jgi:hypothetical protein